MTHSRDSIDEISWGLRLGISISRIVVSLPETSFFRFGEVSSATIFPWSMMPMRWQRISASTIMWVVRMIVVLFSLLIFFMNSLTSTEDWGSSPSVGSSSRRTFGMLSSALITFILCLMPDEKVPTWTFFHLLS